MLSQNTIDAIHNDLTTEQIISDYITLKKAGANYKASCPFHNEKTGSFTVNNQKGRWTCFGGCGGGDAISFVMKHENLDFIAACKQIAHKHGIAIEETEVKGKTNEQIQDEVVMQTLVQSASEHYRKNIQYQTLSGLSWPVKKQWAKVRQYLIHTRKLSAESILDWQIGLCADWKVMAPEIIADGKYKLAEQCGLLRTGNGNTYDFFHHRITIPIHNHNGQVIGMGGRIMPGTDGAKYLNPPESAIYPKSRVLFGLHKARKHFQKMGGAVLVEGYFDVIKLHQCGWTNAIASCGTALTEDQAKLLKKHTDTVFIMRDGDRAGREAMKKDIAVLAPLQFKIYVFILPDKEDPDSVFDKYFQYTPYMAPAKYKSWFRDQVDGIEWLCLQYLEITSDPSQRAENIEKVVKVLSDIANIVRRDQYMKNLVALMPKGFLKIADLAKPLDKFFQQRKLEAEAAATEDQDEWGLIPQWADRKQLLEHGFVQLTQSTNTHKSGIYFLEGNSLTRVTNFTIKPLYHIFEQSNNRRLMEVNNAIRSVVVEMPSGGMIASAIFETELVTRGHFVTLDTFNRKHFKRLTAWLGVAMPIAYELKTLGWQPEGFFAYSNAVYDPETCQLLEYDEMGMIQIGEKYYMSLGNSKIHKDERDTDNPYENDLYLKYVKPPMV